MTLETLDRSIYQWLMTKLVAANAMVNILDFPPGQETDYLAAQVTLKGSNGLGEVVQLYGQGRPEARDTKAGAKVTINRSDTRPGQIGGAPSEILLPYDVGGQTFYRRYRVQDRTYDITYDIRTTAVRTVTDRVIQECIDRAFGQRNYIPQWDSDTEAFSTAEEDMLFIEYMNSISLPDSEFNERILRYRLVDVWVNDLELLEEGITQLRQVTLDINGIDFPVDSVPNVDVHALSCDNLNDPVVGITYDQILSCLIGRLNFSDTDTQNALSSGQIAQLNAWLGTGGGPTDVVITGIDDQPPYDA